MRDRASFPKICLCSRFCAVFLSPGTNVVLFLVWGRGDGRTPLQTEIYALLLGRKGEGGEFFSVCCFSLAFIAK